MVPRSRSISIEAYRLAICTDCRRCSSTHLAIACLLETCCRPLCGPSVLARAAPRTILRDPPQRCACRGPGGDSATHESVARSITPAATAFRTGGGALGHNHAACRPLMQWCSGGPPVPMIRVRQHVLPAALPRPRQEARSSLSPTQLLHCSRSASLKRGNQCIGSFVGRFGPSKPARE